MAATPEYIELQQKQARLSDLSLKLSKVRALYAGRRAEFEREAHEKRYHGESFDEAAASRSLERFDNDIEALQGQYDHVRADVNRLIEEVSHQ